MHQGKLVFAQLMLYLPLGTFRRCVADQNGQHKVKDFSCLDQFFAMAFAQLTFVVFLSAAGRARAVNSSKGDSNNVGTVG